MKGLSEKDYQRIVNFMDYLIEPSENFREHVLISFEKFFGFHKSNFWFCNGDRELIDPIVLNTHHSITVDYLENYIDIDPLTPTKVKSNVVRITDVLSIQQYEESDFYKGFMNKYGYYYSLAIFLNDGQRDLGVIDFVRSRDEGPFTNEEVRCLGILSRHILQTMIFRQKFEEIPYIEKDLTSSHITHLGKSNNHHLTEKEKEVLNFARKGYTNSEIASELYISVNTVKKHMQSLYKKFNVSNRATLCHKVYNSAI